jgi:hypothetical protein
MKNVDANLGVVRGKQNLQAVVDSQMTVFLDEFSDKLRLPTPSNSRHHNSL